MTETSVRRPLQDTMTSGVSNMVSPTHEVCRRLEGWYATIPRCALLSVVMVPASYIANTITSLAGITSVSKRAWED